MSTWILWSPKDTPESKFPADYMSGLARDAYQTGIESEACSECGFMIRWISDTYQFENYNRETHLFIASYLERQRINGECPDHPKPNWIV